MKGPRVDDSEEPNAAVLRSCGLLATVIFLEFLVWDDPWGFERDGSKARGVRYQKRRPLLVLVPVTQVLLVEQLTCCAIRTNHCDAWAGRERSLP